MTPRRSTGKTRIARALWYARKGIAELRLTPLKPVAPGEARVRTLWSGLSRGTERLVFDGAVGESEWQRMRCPLQEGDFPFPVKYGYCATGIVEEGPKELLGRQVFCLHPHQDVFVAPCDMLIPIPDAVPARRATLAANMETALNAVWDSGAGPGDRIVVIGAGVVGLLVGSLAARLPGADVTVIDIVVERGRIVEALGARFAIPDNAPTNADVVFHTSAKAAGLNCAIAAAGQEAVIVEMSWYGKAAVALELGGPFHSRRLKLLSSQVGQISPARRPRWNFRRRLEAAVTLLSQSALDALVEEVLAFEDAPQRLAEIFAAQSRQLAPVIRYSKA
jgi:threonine dehydrogenase-like Zn-dependent dehydrogenase